MKNFAKKTLFRACKPVLSKIQFLKNSHKGEKCYLFGDGISIKWFDLGKFSDSLSIPCGYIPFHNDFEKLNVEHFLLIEPWFFYPFHRTTSPPKRILRNNLQKLYRKDVFEKHRQKKFIFNLSNFPIVNRENVFFTFKELHDPQHEEDLITNRIDCFSGSLRATVFLAIYLGFDQCSLVGFDYTHLPGRSHHWYEKGTGIFKTLQNYNAEFFNIAKEFIDITTITLDGKSEFLDSKTYSELTGSKPVYKENTEIANRTYLDAFAQWPGFKIY